MDDNSIQDFYFTHKKKYKYTVYEYSQLNKAKSTLYNNLVCRLSSHDKFLYHPVSRFETFQLLDGSIIRFTEGTAILFETTEGYRLWLFLAKCIKYALNKWGQQETLVAGNVSYIVVDSDLAEILVVCSKYKRTNGWDIHFTIDGMYIASERREKFMVFDAEEDMQRYIELNSLKEE